MYDRESREITFTQSSEASSMRDSLMSVGPIADNRERLESYDNRLDADGGGAQYRN